jgi:predicted GTPase
MINREELKKQIPRGYLKVIAMRAGVGKQSISKYFNNTLNSEKIEMAALEVASELKQKKDGFIKILNL